MVSKASRKKFFFAKTKKKSPYNYTEHTRKEFHGPKWTPKYKKRTFILTPKSPPPPHSDFMV